jgi:hypothetical protein
MKKLFYLCFTVLFLAAVSAHCVEYQKKEVIEFGGSASYISTDGYTQIQLAPEYNYFVSDNTSLGGIFLYQKWEGIDAVTALLLAPRYFFKSEKKDVHPYGSILWNLQKDYSGFGFGLGLRRKMLANALFNLELRYMAGDLKQTGIFAGFSLYTQKNKK